MAGVDNLTQVGGDRFAEKAAMVAVIAAALGEGADDDEIREAFGMGQWRVVTEAHRLRYGEYFAEKTYVAMIDAMRAGVVGGRLAIRDFVTIEKGELPAGELFPVFNYGPCIEANMVLADVSLAAGADDSISIEQGYQGRWERWKDGIVGGVIEGFPEEYQVIDEAAGLYLVPGSITMKIDYGGLYQESFPVVNGLVVRGHVEIVPSPAGGASMVHNLVVDDARPALDGSVPWVGGANVGFGGPLQAWELGRPYFNPDSFPSRAFSLAAVEAVAGAMAESVLPAAAVHGLDPGEIPLSISGWSNCFPRKKWICGIERIQPGGGYKMEYSPVGWITRAEWLQRYGSAIDEIIEDGGVVPADLVGDAVPGMRFYAKFAPSFIEELNA